MTRREQLQEQYEDALFALLMDELATMENQRAEEENERLQNDPSAAVPEDLDRRCMRLIRRHFARRRARAVGRSVRKAMKLVALAAGIAAILLTTVCAASETVRVNMLNLMIEVFETNTEFRFINASVQTAPQLEVGWVPDGYVLTNQGSDRLEIWHEYQGAENRILSISCERTDGLTVDIDTEDAGVEYILVKSTPAMLVHKGNNLQLAWASKDNSLFISIMGNEIEKEDIIHVANELHY